MLETNLKFAKINIYACDFARSYDCVKDPSRLLDWLKIMQPLSVELTDVNRRS